MKHFGGHFFDSLRVNSRDQCVRATLETIVHNLKEGWEASPNGSLSPLQRPGVDRREDMLRRRSRVMACFP
jgi:hypothetical protein